MTRSRRALFGFVIVAATIIIIMGGVIVRDFWNWFVAPLGAHPITFLHALGLGMLARFLIQDWSGTNVPFDRTPKQAVWLMCMAVAGLLGAWILGAAIAWVM